jgi:hypothetical protein
VSESFDAYHQWLGIPPKYQPPDHYRLLGVEQFEEDSDVISDAAERQIAHVRRKSLSQHSSLSQKLLNELASAKACLIHPDKKKEYDVALRKRLLATTKQAVPAADLPTNRAQVTDSRVRQSSPSPIAAPARNSAVTQHFQRDAANNYSASSPSTQIRVACLCGQRFLAESYLAGSVVSCSKCGSQIQVPVPSLEPAVDLSTLGPINFDPLAQPVADPLGNWQYPTTRHRADADVFQQVIKFLKPFASPRQLFRIATVIAICVAIFVSLSLGVPWVSRIAKNFDAVEQPSIPQPQIPQPQIPQPQIPEPSIPQTNMPDTSIPQTNMPEPDMSQTNTPQPYSPPPNFREWKIPPPNIPQPNIRPPNMPQPNIPQPNRPFTVRSTYSTWISEGTRLEVRAREHGFIPTTGPVRFELQPGAPRGVTVDEATGIVSWTPDADQGPNHYSFTVHAILTDSGHIAQQFTLNIHVRESNRTRMMGPIPNNPGVPRKNVRFRE